MSVHVGSGVAEHKKGPYRFPSASPSSVHKRHVDLWALVFFRETPKCQKLRNVGKCRRFPPPFFFPISIKRLSLFSVTSRMWPVHVSLVPNKSRADLFIFSFLFFFKTRTNGCERFTRFSRVEESVEIAQNCLEIDLQMNILWCFPKSGTRLETVSIVCSKRELNNVGFYCVFFKQKLCDFMCVMRKTGAPMDGNGFRTFPGYLVDYLTQN